MVPLTKIPSSLLAGGPCTETGEDALARVSFDKSSVRRAALAQTGIITGCYGATLGILQRNKPRYLSIVPARPAPSKGK